MNWTIYVLFMIYTAALVYGAYRLKRLEGKLDGKMDKRKSGPRPNARKVKAMPIIDGSLEQDDERIVSYKCSACGEPTPKGGHTKSKCAQEQALKGM